MALPLVPYTILKFCLAASKKTKTSHCQCFKQFSNFSTCSNLTLVLLFAAMIVLVYYIKNMSDELEPMLLKCLKWAYAIALKNSSFELFGILGLEHEASDNEIKKAYRKLSVHYRKLAPGDRCGISLKVVKVYRQLCDASSAVNYFMKPSLAPSKVMDVFTKAAEYMEIPVGRTDTELLQKLFLLVSSELNLELKNIKQEQANFWKQHPALVKVYCVMRAVPLSARKAIGGSGEGIALLLQLLHWSEAVCKKIACTLFDSSC